MVDTTNVESMYAHAARYSAMTSPFNASGQPAIGREDLLLRVAAHVEAARPWPTEPCWPPRD